MRDKYLCQEGIKEKYDSRGFFINSFKYGGACCGLGGVILSIGSENVVTMLIEGGVGVGSYLLGDYLNKVNSNRKEKALKNVEARLLAEGRR